MSTKVTIYDPEAFKESLKSPNDKLTVIDNRVNLL